MRRLLAVLFSLAAMPAFAADASDVPPPDLVDPFLVLALFVVLFVAASWSLAVFVQMASYPTRRLFVKRRFFGK